MPDATAHSTSAERARVAAQPGHPGWLKRLLGWLKRLPGRLKRLPGWLKRPSGPIELNRKSKRYGLRNAVIATVGALIVGSVLIVQDLQAVRDESYFEQYLIMDVIAALVLAPLFITVYLSLREIMRRLLIRLDDNGVIGSTAAGTSLRKFALDLDGWLDRRWLWVLTAAATGLYFIYTLWDSLDEMDSGLARLLIASTLVVQVPLFFLGVLTTFQLGVACWGMGWLLRNSELRTQALHPDGCGGLRAVGHMLTLVLSAAAIIGAASLCMFLAVKATPSQPTRRPEPYVLVFLYVALLPPAFVNLLWRPHQGMDSYRKQILKPVGKKFHEAIIPAWPSTADDSERLKAKTDSLSEITRQFQVLDDALPVWPLRLRRLQAVLAAAVLPVVIPVVTAVVNRMLGP